MRFRGLQVRLHRFSLLNFNISQTVKSVWPFTFSEASVNCPGNFLISDNLVLDLGSQFSMHPGYPGWLVSVSSWRSSLCTLKGIPGIIKVILCFFSCELHRIWSKKSPALSDL